MKEFLPKTVESHLNQMFSKEILKKNFIHDNLVPIFNFKKLKIKLDGLSFFASLNHDLISKLFKEILI